MTHSTAELLDEVRENLEELDRLLPSRLSAADVSQVAKVPFNVLTCRAVLGWRFVELSRCALQCFDQGRMASAVVLTRAALETGAAAWYLHEKITKAIEADTVGDTGDYVMKLLAGSRTVPEAPTAINVLNFVNAIDKQVEGVRRQYDALSEFAHPNWAGAMYLYCKDDEAARSCSFGPDEGAIANATLRASAVLSGSTFIFRHVFEDIERVTPAFIEICEREIGRRVSET